ncbi:MAG: hypothetical protein KKE31_01380 [Planctomycetes bacterium]|nr:hypothetical protein [Planctomycetota bacterium]MBU1518793.1 hypothetical protein [Planctomycetota bacterium]MBU2457272.1 hypothetical protein [Planctomycetota bacterium]
MIEKVITIFGTSSDKVFELAYELGKLCAEAGFTIASGSYGGTMLAAAKGAKSAGGRGFEPPHQFPQHLHLFRIVGKNQCPTFPNKSTL